MIKDLKKFAEENGITLKGQKLIAEEAAKAITSRFRYTPSEIKTNFDNLLQESEKEAYTLYLQNEETYCKKIYSAFASHLINNGELKALNQVGDILGIHYKTFDKFYLSLTQSRRTRAGKTFENIHNSLFKSLGYPFAEQAVIDGKPDFVMPSIEHYKKNPMECIVFTAKRTLRERWRQIVTEGAKGLGFYLATIDEKISPAQLVEMLKNKIYIVCPEKIKNANYSRAPNVLSFRDFFEDHLDPKMKIWKRNAII